MDTEDVQMFVYGNISLKLWGASEESSGDRDNKEITVVKTIQSER